MDRPKMKKPIKKISIAQKAVNFAADRTKGAGHGYPSWTASCIEKGYVAGYKQAVRDLKKKISR